MRLTTTIAKVGRWLFSFLTGLKVSRFPRDQIIEALDQTIAHSESGYYQAGVIVAEIDGFSLLEETHGGAAVAEAVQAIENRLLDGPCSRDVLRRMGEGKFSIVPTPLDHVTLNQLEDLSTTLQALVSQPIQLDGHSTYMTVSVGYAFQGQLTEPSGSILLDAAQAALRAAQRSGPASTSAFDARLQELLATKDERTKEIKVALQNEEIRPFFQPQVAVETLEITGFEALVRWVHPEKGIVSPANFLPQIEELGLMPELGFSMLRSALRAIRQWHDEGYQVPNVSVNFSTEELRSPNLCQFVTLELEKNDLPPETLTIEVLETVVAGEDSGAIQHNLKCLSEMGCKLDLDDFGTGNASITTIRTFGVDRIKIDRSFVKNCHSDASNGVMIEAMIAISDKLGVEILAEGAESKKELQFLANVNCPSVQGYIIARPMPGTKVISWIEDWEAKRQQQTTAPLRKEAI